MPKQVRHDEREYFSPCGARDHVNEERVLHDLSPANPELVEGEAGELVKIVVRVIYN